MSDQLYKRLRPLREGRPQLFRGEFEPDLGRPVPSGTRRSDSGSQARNSGHFPLRGHIRHEPSNVLHRSMGGSECSPHVEPNRNHAPLDIPLATHASSSVECCDGLALALIGYVSVALVVPSIPGRYLDRVKPTVRPAWRSGALPREQCFRGWADECYLPGRRRGAGAAASALGAVTVRPSARAASAVPARRPGAAVGAPR